MTSVREGYQIEPLFDVIDLGGKIQSRHHYCLKCSPRSQKSHPPQRWRKLLETGTHTTVAEIAAAEKINASYVGRVLRLTLVPIVNSIPLA